MSATFELRTANKSGYATVFVRIQSSRLGVNIRQSTHLKVPVRVWQLPADSVARRHYADSAEGYNVFSKLEKIRREINIRIAAGIPISPDEVRLIVASTVFETDISLLNRSKSIGTKHILLNEYIEQYITGMENGTRLSVHGKRYAKGSVDAARQTMKKFREYQESKQMTLGFQDIDMRFYKEFITYLQSCNYSINSIGKCINGIKNLLRAAESDGYNGFTYYRDHRFKAYSVNTDSIYLTREELDRFMSVNLDKYRKCYEYARDIFYVGVCTAQRVSDYSNISSRNMRQINVNDKEKDSKKFTTIEIIQKKTGNKVSIPVSTSLEKVLQKYDWKLPHISEPRLNKYIKVVGRLAGIDSPVEIVRTNGGTERRETLRKHELICTHTARRTGATLMYLSGMDIYDIMKITGHTSPSILKKYIKANDLDVAIKIKNKYDYFD
ncbi:MAG: site-specific integrase [Bacteroidaceae bacterium]|nr:site-specific integrase [Bacteroidaceae bacterium]